MAKRLVTDIAGQTFRPSVVRGVRLLLVVGLLMASSLATSSADPIANLRQRHLGPDGLPSESAYARSHGILPSSESFDWQVVFKLTFLTADVARLNEASAIHTDCYFIRSRRFAAAQRVQPVWDGRVEYANDRLIVAAYTNKGERIFGHIDERSRVVRTADASEPIPMPDLDGVEYNPFTGQLWRPIRGGDSEDRQRVYLPITLVDVRGEHVQPTCRIVQGKSGEFSLVAGSGPTEITLATCRLTSGGDVKHSGGYSPATGPGCKLLTGEPTTVFEVPGKLAAELWSTQAAQLVVRRELSSTKPPKTVVRIDGSFDEWRSVPGITDPERDIVSYLQYNADTDLLEFKVTSDNQYLYVYTRVAGRHGNTGPNLQSPTDRDRYYYYIYMDVDRNPRTGYLPTRDDECYYGVTLGVDCEPQFEFIDGRFMKNFYGFAGRSTEADVERGRVALGPSWYNRHDDQGRLRDGYKVEYTRSAGQARITKDLAEGTSDDIEIAFSPDGSECEMRAALSGFLQNKDGKPIVAPGQRIDLAAGVETSGRIRGNTRWSADSTAPIRGYLVAE
jgi:hypothetical protein